MSGEFAVIERLRRVLPGPPAGETWIGDDAAVVLPPKGGLLLTSDAVVAGVHFDLSLVALDDVGWKAVSVAVSDIAAMGCRPLYALMTVCGPPDTDVDLLYRGVAEATEAYACPVVGGDLVGAPNLVIAVAVAGETGHRRPVLRAGAMPGDRVFVTGRLGGSAAGLRLLREGRIRPDDPLAIAHRRPIARLDEGRAARAAGATAMVDVSDGLAADLGHLARESGVGVALDAVPVATGATLADALGGGEDFELLFTATNSGHVAATFAEAGLRQPLGLGYCTADPDERTLAGEPLPAAGWEHDFR
jgi:thiamine-monophosphate kinase